MLAWGVQALECVRPDRGRILYRYEIFFFGRGGEYGLCNTQGRPFSEHDKLPSTEMDDLWVRYEALQFGQLQNSRHIISREKQRLLLSGPLNPMKNTKTSQSAQSNKYRERTYSPGSTESSSGYQSSQTAADCFGRKKPTRRFLRPGPSPRRQARAFQNAHSKVRKALRCRKKPSVALWRSTRHPSVPVRRAIKKSKCQGCQQCHKPTDHHEDRKSPQVRLLPPEEGIRCQSPLVPS